MIRSSLGTLAAALILSGCMNMSGLEAQSNFSCKAPPGVSCQSISGTYSNSLQNNLPFQQQKHAAADVKGQEKERKPLPPDSERREKLSPRDMDASTSGIPIRQPPLVLRVWIAPYEDEAGDLHDQSYFYTMVHSGKWMIEANRSAISSQFRPVFPLKQKQAASEEQSPSPAPQSGPMLPQASAAPNPYQQPDMSGDATYRGGPN